MGVFLTTGLVVVGFSGGSIERIPANHLLVKNVSASVFGRVLEEQAACGG